MFIFALSLQTRCKIMQTNCNTITQDTMKLKHGIITEAANRLSLSRTSIYRCLKSSDLRVIRVIHELQSKANEEKHLAKELLKSLQRTN